MKAKLDNFMRKLFSLRKKKENLFCLLTPRDLTFNVTAVM